MTIELIQLTRIHVYNPIQFILAALPYYSHDVFVRFVDVIPNLPPIFSFLANSKKQAKSPGKNLIVRALSTDAQLNELINRHVVEMVAAKRDFHQLLAFWSSTSIWSMVSLKEVGVSPDEIISRYLPSISSMIVERKSSDAQIAAYMTLSVIGSQFRLNDDILEATIDTISSNWTKNTAISGLSCIAQLVKNKESLRPLSKNVFTSIFKIKNVNNEIFEICHKYDIGQFIIIWFISTLENAPDKINPLSNLLFDLPLHSQELQKIFEYAIHFSVSRDLNSNVKTQLTLFLENAAKFDEPFTNALHHSKITVTMLELSLQSSLSVSNSSMVESDGDLQMTDSLLSELTAEMPSKDAVMEEISCLTLSKSLSSFLVFSVTDEFSFIYKLYSNAIVYKAEDHLLCRLPIECRISFLCRIWTGAYSTIARINALRTLASIIRENDSLDLQGIIPALITGLIDNSEKVRRYSGTCIQLLANDSKKYSRVWGLDNLYGDKLSSDLKWMSSSEVRKLLQYGICPSLEECYLDSSFIFEIFVKMSGMKELRTTAASLAACLSSHALIVQLPHYKSSLIRFVNSLEKTNSKSLYPIFDTWLQQRDNTMKLCKQEKAFFDILEQAVMDIIVSGDKQNIKFLENCMRFKNSNSLTRLAGSKIVQIFSQTRSELQLIIVRFLLDIAIDDSILYDSLEVLNQLPVTMSTFGSLLEEVQLEKDMNSNTGSTVAKRRRRSSTMTRQQFEAGGQLANYAEKHLRKLTAVLELFDRNRPDANSKILSQLFTILGELLSLELDSKIPVLYTEQLLSDCMIHVVDSLKLQRATKVDSNSIRVDLIVSCIRSSSVPQVQNRLLLLIAQLANLAPQVVLHSVMPIFTFMGANTVRQDDDFSAHVIEQTIAYVVPALLQTQEAEESEEIDYLLLSFVAAFVHIPRHRRVKLFGALVRTLSPHASLYKLLALLAKKFVDAKARRKTPEARSYLLFGESFLRSFTVTEQLSAINSFLLLCNKIPVRDSDSISPVKLLNLTPESEILYLQNLKNGLYQYICTIVKNDETVYGQLLKVKIALIVNSADISDDEKKSVINICLQMISQLMRIRAEDEGVSQKLDISVLNTLKMILELLPIEIFAKITCELIVTSKDPEITRQAATLMCSEFETETTNNKTSQLAATYVIETLTPYIRDSSTIAPDILHSLFDALEMVVSRFGHYVDHEKIIELLGVLTKEKGLRVGETSVLISAISCVNACCMELGARMISQFTSIVPPMLNKAETICNNNDDNSVMIQMAIFGLLSGLFKRIPTFMVTSLDKTLQLVFCSKCDSTIRRRILEVIIETMELKDFIASLYQSWEYAKLNLESIDLYIESLDAIVDQSTKKAVSLEADLFINIVVQVFTFREEQLATKHEVNRVEAKIIESALKVVMKLNDKTFRPLFVRMVTWMTNGPHSSAIKRYTVFFKFLVRVLSNLKSIVTNYYGYIVDITCDFLENNKDEENKEDYQILKRTILNSLVISFQYDRDEFWQSQARFDKISKTLLHQIPDIIPNLGPLLVRTIVSLSESCGSPDNYKKINEGIVVYLRPENRPHDKLWSIKTLEGLYEKIGEEWITMLPQLIPLIAELLEDDNESVEMEVRRKLIPIIEEQLGESLDRYLS